jgi:hypothetical protein
VKLNGIFTSVCRSCAKATVDETITVITSAVKAITLSKYFMIALLSTPITRKEKQKRSIPDYAEPVKSVNGIIS